MIEQLKEELKKRIVILDGPRGTMIQKLKLDESGFRGERLNDFPGELKGNNDILNITRPEIISRIYEQYLEAGSDIIGTNTFNSTSVSQADYNTQEFVYEMNFNSAKLARAAADKFTKITPGKPRYVAGAIGPMNKTLSMSPDVNDPGFRAVTFDEIKESYREAAKGLIDGGVDLLLVETVFDTLNCKAALYAINELFYQTGRKLPVMVSGTIVDMSGRTLSGQTVEAFLNSVMHAELFSIGLNCSLGAKEMRPYLEELSQKANIYISCLSKCRTAECVRRI